jgi:two-component system phosphate regulon sensor histidine kinase PhoR
MSSRTIYPWFFFYRISRLTLVVFLPTLFLILFLYRSSYRSGLLSQLEQEAQKDLDFIKITLSFHSLNSPSFCKSIGAIHNSHYILLRLNGTPACEGHQDLQKDVAISRVTRINNNFLLKKVIPLASLKDNMDRFDKTLFSRIVPFAILSYLIFIFLFYHLTKPLGMILSKVEKFKNDIPFNKSLALFYKRDEWGSIEEALNKADLKLEAQILEAKMENEKNTAILESINDAIIAIDKFESILFYNSKFNKNFIFSGEGKEIHKKIWHMFEDIVLSAFREVLKTGEPQKLKAMNFPLSHSPDHLFDIKITPLKSSDGMINGALGVFYDVTEFKRAEQMRVDFVANISHEIRTPLTSIKGFSQILQIQSGKVDSTLHPFLEKIVANTERMISLFNDLLHLSVIESRNEIKLDFFSLSEVIDEIMGNTIANFPHKDITFQNDIRFDQLIGDFRLIEQVLLNLCDNACKYAGNKVTIKISNFIKDDRIYLLIEDDGPGVAKEHLSRIFERFYRVDASRESLRGTGLGLSIVKQIISKHRGKIWAESEGENKGTKFIIELSYRSKEIL